MSLLVAILCYASFILVNLPLTIAEDDLLSSDKAALLAFSTALTKSGRLNWNEGENDDVCSWLGVNCTEVPTVVSRWSNGGIREVKWDVRVTRINLPAVGLFGPIAANSIGNLSALRTLNLRSNVLYGSIPNDIMYIDTLIFLILSNNRFCGDIPRFKESPPKDLMVFDLSDNGFTGHIPPVLALLGKLTNLSLENNLFWGEVPNIALSPHRMYGYKAYLNLSYNKLEGEIPHAIQRLNFPEDSFIGNYKLCGKPLISCDMLAPAPAPLSDTAAPFKVGTFAFMVIILFLFLNSIPT